ncbi:MAG: hypothetical protein KW802_02410 [Candidatus Doudnabacteria bacterium]|nr:hypothetical protein [Candidatus Doudnabacteria bacterium]
MTQEDLMRAKEARRATIWQLIAFDLGSKLMAYGGMLYAIHLAFVVNTLDSNRAATLVVLSAVCILFNGGDLLHRKWSEYRIMELSAESVEGSTFHNPSLVVSRKSQRNVGLTSLFAFGAPAVTILIHALSFLLR